MPAIVIKEPKISRMLFSEVGPWSFVWLALRMYLGYEWIAAGWHKVLGDGWGPESIKAYWVRAVQIPEAGRPPIAYDWYRSFLQFLLDSGAESWMSHLIAWGELLVGVALVLGLFTGIAAAFGAFMNLNFMLAGTTSTNPVLMLLAMLLVMAWKTAGWWGLDRYALLAIGTPWARVELDRNQCG